MEKIKKAIVPFSGTVLAIVLIIVTSLKFEGSATENPTYPKRGDIVEQLKLLGKVQPQDKFELGFQVSGKVSYVYVGVGSSVKKGQLLAELVQDDSNIANSQAIADLQAAQAQLEQAKKEREMQKAKLKSIKESSSYNEHDERAQKELINQSDANVEAKSANVQKMNESVQNARNQIGKTRIYAPWDGVITKQSLQRGEAVSAYFPVISMIGDKALGIEAFVSEIEMAKISAGDLARVRIMLDQVEELEASVSSVDPIETVSGNVSSYKITIIPSKQSEKLKSGTVADILLNLGEKKNALIIPMKSVFQEGGKYFVLVENGKDYVAKDVVLGVRDQAGNSEVLSGIGEDDKIVSFNQSN